MSVTTRLKKESKNILDPEILFKLKESRFKSIARTNNLLKEHQISKDKTLSNETNNLFKKIRTYTDKELAILKSVDCNLKKLQHHTDNSNIPNLLKKRFESLVPKTEELTKLAFQLNSKVLHYFCEENFEKALKDKDIHKSNIEKLNFFMKKEKLHSKASQLIKDLKKLEQEKNKLANNKNSLIFYEAAILTFSTCCILCLKTTNNFKTPKFIEKIKKILSIKSKTSFIKDLHHRARNNLLKTK